MSATTDRPCPQCGRQAAPRRENRDAPFCSGRCRDIDLGKWFGEKYVISGPALDSPPMDPGSREDDD